MNKVNQFINFIKKKIKYLKYLLFNKNVWYTYSSRYKRMRCPKCQENMILITGTYGHYLKNFYWKCLNCANEILEKENEK